MPLRAHLPPSKKEEIAASWPVENGPCVLALLGPVRVGIHTSNTCLLRKLFHSFSSLSLSLSLPFSVSYSSIFVDYLMARQRERERVNNGTKEQGSCCSSIRSFGYLIFVRFMVNLASSEISGNCSRILLFAHIRTRI